MNRIYYTIEGKPKPQKRHRDRVGGKYDPSAQDKREFNLQSRRYAPEAPISGPVLLYVVFYMPVPKGALVGLKTVVDDWDWAYGKNTPRQISKFEAIGTPFHTKRPDSSNMLKFIEDALTGLFWVDDSQVQIGGCFKIYSHNPRTEIELYWEKP